jgi:hypothetical protein
MLAFTISAHVPRIRLRGIPQASDGCLFLTGPDVRSQLPTLPV